MLTQGSITLWHQRGIDPVTRRENPPERRFYPAVSIRLVENAGEKEQDRLSLRIPGTAAEPITPGDRLVLGKNENSLPPEGAYRVLSISDNRRGSLAVWHSKVVAQ